MDEDAVRADNRVSAIERWRRVRWWRTISPVLQHNPVNVVAFIEHRIQELDAAWDERFEEVSDRLNAFVIQLERDQLGAPTDHTFAKVAEKFRRRELRAMLVAHLATEMSTKVRARAKPMLDALEALDRDDHKAALLVGDLPSFDEFTRNLFPNGTVAAAGWAVDEAVESRSMNTVDSLIADIGVARIDDEFRNLLSFDSTAVALRLERELARRTTTIDLRSDEPQIHLPDTDEPLVSRPESEPAQA
jgi:hypothetical protein